MSCNFKGKFTDALVLDRTVICKYINSLPVTNILFVSTSLRHTPSEENSGKKFGATSVTNPSRSLTELVQQQVLFASSALHAVRVLSFNQ